MLLVYITAAEKQSVPAPGMELGSLALQGKKQELYQLRHFVGSFYRCFGMGSYTIVQAGLKYTAILLPQSPVCQD